MLCRTLGRWAHPDDMLAEMPASHFDDWLAAYQAEPWGEERADMRMGRIAWAILQVASPKKKVDERKLRFNFRPRQPITPEDYRRKSMRAYAHNGGRVPSAGALGV